MANTTKNPKDQTIEKMVKDKIADSMKLRCRVCHETINPMRCKCTGKKGGGSGGGDDQSSTDEKKTFIDAQGKRRHDDENKSQDITYKVTDFSDNEYHGYELQLSDVPFNQLIISALLASGKLVINNDLLEEILTIKLPFGMRALSAKEQVEYLKLVQAIRDELKAFREAHGLTSKCAAFKHDADGNIIEMRISFPKPGLYAAFIAKLAEKQLLPIANINQQGKPVYEPGVNLFNPTPFAKTPMPTDRNNYLPKLKPKNALD